MQLCWISCLCLNCLKHSLLDLCNLCQLVIDYQHAFKTFERLESIRKTIIIISNETIPMVWSMPLSQVSNDPNQLDLKPSKWSKYPREAGHFFKQWPVYVSHVLCFQSARSVYSASYCLSRGGTGNQGTCLNGQKDRITSIYQIQLSVGGWRVNYSEVLNNGIIFWEQ